MNHESSLYFALCSSIVSKDREVDELLDRYGLTIIQYKKYEDWWFSSDAQNVLDRLINSFIELFVSNFGESYKNVDWETFFVDLDDGAWSDFLREIHEIQKGDTEYFLTYAIDQSLLWEFDGELPLLETDEVNENSDMGPDLDELRKEFGRWYIKSAVEIGKIFNDVRPLIEKSGVLSN